MLVSTVPEGLDKTSLYCPVSPRTLLGIDRVASSLFVYHIQNVFLLLYSIIAYEFRLNTRQLVKSQKSFFRQLDGKNRYLK